MIQVFLLLIFAVACSAQWAQAYVHALPSRIAEEALSESVPTAFAPVDFSPEDYVLEWVGNPIEGVILSLGAESLEWVRVADLLVVPRARLLVSISNVEAGLLSNNGFSQSLAIKDGVGTAELPIALLSTELNPVQFVVVRGSKEVRGSVRVRFRPRDSFQDSLVFADPSCSSFGVRAAVTRFKKDSWMYVGCRLVYVEGALHRTSSLEVFIYWDNVGQEIEVGGIKTASTGTSVWPLRLRSTPGSVVLKAEGSELALHYFIPERLRLGFVGFGIGPYTYVYEAEDVDVHSVAPVLTVYGSFFVTESMRIVAFNATALHRKYFTDIGVYLNSEYIKTLDRRFVLNIMLGAHVIGFEAEKRTYYNFGIPQGMEMIFKDAFAKGYNFAAGAFIYPPIQGKLYYNAWLRWGGGRWFAEFNYIAWQEMLEKNRAYNRSVGFTFGFPLIRFF